ncbi:AAA family ATPase [Weissella viridescens]
MYFIIDRNEIEQAERTKQPFIELILNGWNDFGYRTIYAVNFVSSEGERQYIGSTKIAMKNMKQPDYYEEGVRADLPKKFEKLNADFFSLGMDVKFYKNVKKLESEGEAAGVLSALRDIVEDTSIKNDIKNESVLKQSLMREIAAGTIENEFRNAINNGNNPLDLADFKIIVKDKSEDGELTIPESERTMHIQVKKESSPQTYVHTLIGRNGVGKSNLFKNIIDFLCDAETYNNEEAETKVIEDIRGADNIVSVMAMSYSLFDTTLPKMDIPTITGKPYKFVGIPESVDMIVEVKRDESKETKETKETKTVPIAEVIENYITKSFMENFVKVKTEIDRKNLVIACIEKLESDPIFSELHVTEWFKENNESRLKENYKRLSSGHRTVLLSLFELINNINANSLILIDEPELSLHPPLVSSYIQAIIEVLKHKNAVAIIATHSPVILQECATEATSIIDRNRKNIRISGPTVHTFGANVGTLTQDVFGLEVIRSGYSKILNDTIYNQDVNDIEQIVSIFDNQLGTDAYSLAMSVLARKKKQQSEVI